MNGSVPPTHSKLMHEVLATIERVAGSDVNLIIVGEPGTGKEWAAHLIHRLSARSSGPFTPIDCAALAAETAERELFGFESISGTGVEITRGFFEEGSGGTVLLNDIAALPHTIQMKILRAIEYSTIRRIGSEQDIPVDVRVIATLREDPSDLLRKEILRKELYYSISPMVIEMPPLRNRREDVPLLIEGFLDELRSHGAPGEYTFTSEALRLCCDYDWPGNVRLLRNAVEYAVVMSDGYPVKAEHLPHYIHKKGDGGGQHPSTPSPDVSRR